MKRQMITVWVTPDEKEMVAGLAYGGNVSEYIRQLMRADAEMRGVDWPEKALTDTRGKYQRPAK